MNHSIFPILFSLFAASLCRHSLTQMNVDENTTVRGATSHKEDRVRAWEKYRQQNTGKMSSGSSRRGFTAAVVDTSVDDAANAAHPAVITNLLASIVNCNLITFLSMAHSKFVADDMPPKMWRSLPNLVVVNLSSNALSAVPRGLLSLEHTPHLWQVDLSHNNIRTFQSPFFQSRPLLGLLSLVGNDNMTEVDYLDGMKGFVCGELLTPLNFAQRAENMEEKVKSVMLGVLVLNGCLVKAPPQPHLARCESHHQLIRRSMKSWAQVLLLERFKVMFTEACSNMEFERNQTVTAVSLVKHGCALHRVSHTNVSVASVRTEHCGGASGEGTVRYGSTAFAAPSGDVLNSPPFCKETWESLDGTILVTVSHLLHSWRTLGVVSVQTVHCAIVSMLLHTNPDLSILVQGYPLYAWYVVHYLMHTSFKIVFPRSTEELHVEDVIAAIENAKACVHSADASEVAPSTIDVPQKLQVIAKKNAAAPAVVSEEEAHLAVEMKERAKFRALLFQKISRLGVSIPPSGISTNTSGETNLLDASPNLGAPIRSLISGVVVAADTAKYEHDTSWVHTSSRHSKLGFEALAQRLREKQDALRQMSAASTRNSHSVPMHVKCLPLQPGADSQSTSAAADSTLANVSAVGSVDNAAPLSVLLSRWGTP